MTIRNLMQTGLIKTSNAALSLRHKLERTPKDELIDALKTSEISDDVLVDLLNFLMQRLEEEADNA